MNRTKIALVGIGKIARDQHIPAILQGRAFDLAATASRNGKVDGVEAFTNLPDLLAARPDIPCISLCTPPQVRYDDARAAILAGRHVMLEKPPGASLSEVHALADLAAAHKRTLFATWHSRAGAAVSATRDWLAEQTILTVQVVWKEDVRRWHPGQDWIWQAGGMGVFDPGINALSILTEIFPRPLHLTSADLEFPINRDTPIAAQLTFRDPGGAEVSAQFDWRQDGPQTWDIRFDTAAGEAVLSDGGAVLAIGGKTAGTGAPTGEYPNLYTRFAALLAAGQSDVDLAPMRHVADAFTLGRRLPVEAFDW